MSNTFEKEKLIRFKALLENAKRIVITTHHNPDGDAIGSVLGLYHALAVAGISSNMVTPNGFPEFLAWMPATDRIVRYSERKDQATALLMEAEVIICLDFNGFRRTETIEEVLSQAPGKKILIDHHPDPENSFDIQFSRTQVSSTAELIYEVLMATFGEGVINYNSALCLFTGIMTDTGSFSYACSGSNTFGVAGELIGRGVNVERVQGLVYNNFSSDRMRLLGYALNEKMKVFPEYNAAYISLTREELKRFNYKVGDTEGFVNNPLSIKGIIFSVLFVEYETFIKVSLRSRGTFQVNTFSRKHYKGGGHINAAGGKSFISLANTEREFETLLVSYADELNRSSE